MELFTDITAKDNQTIKLISSLVSSSSKRSEYGLFVLEGLRLCEDAVINNAQIEILAVSYSAYNKFTDDIKKFAQKSKKSIKIPDKLFEKISDTKSPQGILTVNKIPKTDNKLNSNGRYIALENVQDPSNIGAVSRTAEALGVSALIVSGGCDIYSPKALRASMGALLRLNVIRTENIIELIKTADLKSYACIVDGDADKITDINFTDGCVCVIGNEANGLADETKRLCDKRITIPMSGNAESLNAAVAASIVMWEMLK